MHGKCARQGEQQGRKGEGMKQPAFWKKGDKVNIQCWQSHRAEDTQVKHVWAFAQVKLEYAHYNGHTDTELIKREFLSSRSLRSRGIGRKENRS